MADHAGLSSLGPLVVSGPAGATPLGRGRVAVLAAQLASRFDEPVSTEVLAHAIWGDDRPSSAASSLRNHATRLRRLLDEAQGLTLSSATPGFYRLTGDRARLDHLVFIDTLDELGRGSGPTLEACRRALDLWRGDPFDALVDIDQLPLVERLRQGRLDLTLELATKAFDAGDGRRAVAELEPLLVENPGLERHCALLMRALYTEGHQRRALQAYQTTRRWLLENLGIEPGPGLREAEQAILTQEDGEIRTGRGTVRLVEPTPDGLVGRDEEVRRLATAFDETLGDVGHTVEVIGASGLGKTALLDELDAVARNAGAWVVRAAARPSDPHYAALSRLVTQVWPPDAREPIRVLGDVLDPSILPDASPSETAWSVDQTLRSLAESMTVSNEVVVVIVDDAQWLDLASRAAIGSLARLRANRMLVAIASRPLVGNDDPATFRSADRIHLGPLAIEHAEALYLRQRRQARSLDDDQHKVLRQVTSGVPFAIVALAEIGIENFGSATERSLDGVVATRLQSLTPATRQWLSDAALLGPDIDSDDMAELTGFELSDDQLDLTLATGLVERSSDGRLVFTHELGRQAVLAQVEASARAERQLRLLQRAVDTGRARLAAQLAADSTELPLGEALPLLVGGATQAMASRQHSEGLDHVRSAVAMLDRASHSERAAVSPHDEAHVLELWGDLEFRTGDRRAGTRALERAVAVRASLGEHDCCADLVAAVAHRGGNMSSHDPLADLGSDVLTTSLLGSVAKIILEASVLDREMGRRGTTPELLGRAAMLAEEAEPEADRRVRLALARLELTTTGLDRGAAAVVPVAREAVRLADGDESLLGRATWVSGISRWASALASLGDAKGALALLRTFEAGIHRLDMPLARWFLMISRATSMRRRAGEPTLRWVPGCVGRSATSRHRRPMPGALIRRRLASPTPCWRWPTSTLPTSTAPPPLFAARSLLPRRREHIRSTGSRSWWPAMWPSNAASTAVSSRRCGRRCSATRARSRGWPPSARASARRIE